MTDRASEGPAPDSVEASMAVDEPTGLRVVTDPAHPFAKAFVSTIAVLVAVALAAATVTLSSILIMVGVSLFLALALDPVVRKLEGRGLGRGRAIGVVFSVFLALLVVLVFFVIPAAVNQVIHFAQSVPEYTAAIKSSDWFHGLVALTGGPEAWNAALAHGQSWLSDPAHLLAVGTGALAVGVGVINGISVTMIVAVLTLYFLASLDEMKQALYRMTPAYGRDRLADLTERITSAVGGFIAGGITLSGLNASFSFILLLILGVPYAVVLAMVSLVVTLIPMIGSVLFWILGTAVSLLYSPTAGVAFAVVYFIYMQLEAYLITPRIMNKAVAVPGALVLIGAMIGGALLGLLGALVAVPVTASVLLVIRGVYIPYQDARVKTPDQVELSVAHGDVIVED
ncbi:MAG TPA: AI-2E family transporter [Propionibacteriaceae bacterium]|nr:AI-2E family transporter [Propionibacteriaceae bacterium]